MANFQTPTPVQIDQLDLGAIQNNNLRAQSMRLQNTDEQRKQNALATYKDAINQGSSPEQAANALRAMAPEMADKLTQNALTLKTSQAALSNDMDKFIQTRVPLAKDQAGWDSVLNEASARYGIQIPDTLKTYSPELQQNLLMGGLSAAQRIAMERTDNTLRSQGFTPGQDPGALHTIDSMRRGAAADGRAEAQNAREAELQPYRVGNIQSEIDVRKTRAAQPRVIMIPDSNYPLEMKKVPGYYDQETNSVIPMQVAPQQAGGGIPQAGTGGAQQPPAKKLDASTAKQYLQKAGGDANKAREMARAEGWSF